MVKTVWNLSKKVQNYRETFQTVRKLSRLSRNFPDCMETLQTVRKLSRLFGNFFNCPETFHTVWKLFRLSKNFLDCLETFHTFQKHSRLSQNLPNCPETFLTVWNLMSFYLFLGHAGNADTPTGFFCLCHSVRDLDYKWNIITLPLRKGFLSCFTLISFENYNKKSPSHSVRITLLTEWEGGPYGVVALTQREGVKFHRVINDNSYYTLLKDKSTLER